MRICKVYFRDRDGRKRQSQRWYVEFTDHRDAVRRFPAFVDKRASAEFGRRLETLVSLRVSGDQRALGGSVFQVLAQEPHSCGDVASGREAMLGHSAIASTRSLAT